MVVDRNKVAWLERYQKQCDKLEVLNNRITGVQAIQYGDKVRGYSNKTINDYILERDELRATLEDLHLETYRAIKQLGASKGLLILCYRYLDGCTYWEIANKLGYKTADTIKRYHDKAIECFEIPRG